MLVDAQVHVWRAVANHPNPAATIVSPASNVPIELFHQYMDEYRVERAVLVQPVYPGEDNSYIAECSLLDPQRFKAVCVVDPRVPGAASRLESWVKKHRCAGLRLRPRLSDEATCFGDASTFPLWESAQAHKVVISVLMDPEQLSTLDALAARFPTVPIVIDHMGHPDASMGRDSSGFKGLLALARKSNVFVKVSGYYYFSKRQYPFEDCAALFRALYDSFGPARLIWGSDFPHVLLKVGYHRTLQFLERMYPYLSKQHLELIMGANAARLYWGDEYKMASAA